MMVNFFRSSQGLASLRRLGRDDQNIIKGHRAITLLPKRSSRKIYSVSIFLAMLAVAQATLQISTEKWIKDFQVDLHSQYRRGARPGDFPSVAANAVRAEFEGNWNSFTGTAKFELGSNMKMEGSFTLFPKSECPREVKSSKILITKIQEFSVLWFEQISKQSRGHYWIVVPFKDSEKGNAHTLAWYSTYRPGKIFYYTKALNTDAAVFVPLGDEKSERPQTDRRHRNGPVRQIYKVIQGMNVKHVGSDNGETTDEEEAANGGSHSAESTRDADATPWFCHCAGNWVISPANGIANRHKQPKPRKKQLGYYRHGSQTHPRDPNAYIGTLRRATENCEKCTRQNIACEDYPIDHWDFDQKAPRQKFDLSIPKRE